MKFVSSILKNLVSTYDEAFQISCNLLPKYFDMVSAIFVWNRPNQDQIRNQIVDENLIDAVSSIIMGYSLHPENLYGLIHSLTEGEYSQISDFAANWLNNTPQMHKTVASYFWTLLFYANNRPCLA